MIPPGDFEFPMNVVTLLATALDGIDPDIEIHKRPLRSSDGTQCIGIFPTEYRPTPESKEMRGQKLMGQTLYTENIASLGEYDITIQSLVMHTDEEAGIAAHSSLTRRVRTTVARDPGLQVALQALASSTPGDPEKFKKAEVRGQRYLTMELSGTWLYLSVTQFWVQTESR